MTDHVAEDPLVVQCEGLGRTFGDVVALDSLDLEVPRNSIFGFLGPNGAGKTTAMRLLLGLIPPSRGRATVLGRDIVADSVAIRRRVGYLPQQPRFYDDLTARQTLRFSRGFFPPDPDRSMDDAIAEALELVGLTGSADQPSGSLSGGQRQRLGIAQAYIHRPELLILDEPAAALDPIGRRDVLDIMRRLRDTTTILYSTHILDDVQRVSDRVAILDRGRRVAQAPTSVLLDGSDEIVYEMVLGGVTDGVAERLRDQSWVTSVDVQPRDDAHVIEVTVTDDAAARHELLRIVLADRGVEVVRFGRRRWELEDVFVGLVGKAAP